MQKRFVVIGASAASIAFITKLRSIDPACEIICISGETDIPYNRCFLADLLSGEITAEEMHLKPQDFFEEQNILLRLGTWVTKIDATKQVVFVDSEPISYDYLFLGIGSKPFIPSIQVDRLVDDGVFTFHTAEDIAKISSFIATHNPKRMIVVGAGLNGLECAFSLLSCGIAVTVLERSLQVLPAQVDAQLAEYIASLMCDKGINLILGQSALRVESVGGKVSGIVLKNGVSIPADGIVFATGSVVNSELLVGTGIETSHGSIVVDHSMRTNIATIYAGGDICLVSDNVSKALVKSTTWADAMLQGLCAATQFSKFPRNYPGCVGLRDSHFFGYDFYACGQTVGLDSTVQIIRDMGEKGAKAFYLKDGALIGFVLLGDVSKVALYKQWYMTKKEIAEADFY